MEMATKAVRAGQIRTPFQEHSEALYLTSSFVFDSAEQAAAVFAGDEPGYVYSRFTNPTVDTFGNRLAAMEKGEAAVCTASGMAAITALCLSRMEKGDSLVASRQLFGTTVGLFNNLLPRLGMKAHLVDLTDMQQWQAALDKEPKLAFVEAPSNPLSRFVDITALAKMCHDRGVLLAVDNCFLTPALYCPLELGADIVVHSATKFLDGQGRCMGGALVGSKAWIDEAVAILRVTGASMSPFNAWVMLKGLETLSIRVQQSSKTALELARWLQVHPKVRKVYYLGLQEHPDHHLAQDAQLSAFGGVVAFEVAGGTQGAWRVINATKLMSITANLGDTRTTITHSATTTHGRLSPEERVEAGIDDGLIRISSGLEDVEDLKAELDTALAVLP